MLGRRQKNTVRATGTAFVARRSLKKLEQAVPFRLRPHHAKPVRKRHLLGLSISMTLTIVFAATGLRYIYRQYDRQMAASISTQTFVDSMASATASSEKIRSTYGFQLVYNPKQVVATGTVHDGLGKSQFYYGEQLQQSRSYDTLTFLPVSGTGSSLVVTVLTDEKSAHPQESMAKSIAASLGNTTVGSSMAHMDKETHISIGGINFVHQLYRYDAAQSQPQSDRLRMQPERSDVYVGFLPNDMPVAMKLNSAAGQSTVQSQLEAIVKSLTTNSAKESALQNLMPRAGNTHSAFMPSILEKIGLADESVAASGVPVFDSARVIATDAPAVVKLYHVVCGGITYRGQPLVVDDCTATTGTGFIISADGYIATNGHVVSSSARDMVLQNISAPLVRRMLQIDQYSTPEIDAILASLSTAADGRTQAAQAILELPDTVLQYTQAKDFHIVALATDVPDISTIIKDRSFAESATIKQAVVKAVDYNAGDIYNQSGFTHSDIAVLKITGDNYPVIRLGSLDTVAQGASVLVIGYPGDAERTNLVRPDTLQSTATQGIVSAIRDVNGLDGRVVQSDVSIGHGNSGGPALDQSGRVFGIATYLLDNSGETGAPISYLRDIRDLKNVLSAYDITLRTDSATQSLWESGLALFHQAHYRDAIRQFEKVSALYPAHNMSREYIALAQARIANGEESQSAWVAQAVVGGLIISVLGSAWFIAAIVRHRAHHNLYRAVQLGYVRGAFSSIQAISHHGK